MSHVGKALAHNSSNNKADFYFFSPPLACQGSVWAGGEMREANLILGLASAGVWIFIWFAQGYQLSERVIMKINSVKAV